MHSVALDKAHDGGTLTKCNGSQPPPEPSADSGVAGHEPPLELLEFFSRRQSLDLGEALTLLGKLVVGYESSREYEISVLEHDRELLSVQSAS
jgi:hypothetical protein